MEKPPDKPPVKCVVCGETDFADRGNRSKFVLNQTYHMLCFVEFHKEFGKQENRDRNLAQVRQFAAKNAKGVK